MKPPVPLLPDERVIYSSASGGDAGHSGWWWLLVIFFGMQVCNGLMFLGFALGSPEEGTTLMLDGQHLLLASETSKVGFDLLPWDAKRAQTQLPRNEGHPYR